MLQNASPPSKERLFSNRLIWVIEDDPGCCFVYEESLKIRYNLEYIQSLEELETKLSQPHTVPDLMIADLNLKDGNFLNFLSTSDKKSLLTVPFIIVSSSDDIDALRYCFDEGALDYLTKPFKKNELIVKIEKFINQIVAKEGTSEGFDSLDDQFMNRLTLKENLIVSLFKKSPNNCITRDEIFQSIWNNVHVHSKTLDVHIYNLRKKLAKIDLFIKTEGKKFTLTSEKPSTD